MYNSVTLSSDRDVSFPFLIQAQSSCLSVHVFCKFLLKSNLSTHLTSKVSSGRTPHRWPIPHQDGQNVRKHAWKGEDRANDSTIDEVQTGWDGHIRRRHRSGLIN